MDPQTTNKILDLLIINSEASQEELAAIDRGYMDALAAINREAQEMGDEKPIYGIRRDDKIVFVYSPGGRDKSAEKVPETPAPHQVQPGETSRRGKETATADAPPKLPPTPPAFDGPAEAPRLKRSSSPDPSGSPSGPATPPSRPLVVTRIQVTNFRITSSAGRTKITAIPADPQSAGVALELSGQASKTLDLAIWDKEQAEELGVCPQVVAGIPDQAKPEARHEVRGPSPSHQTTAGQIPPETAAGALQGGVKHEDLKRAEQKIQEEVLEGKDPAQIRRELGEQVGKGLPADIAEATAGMMEGTSGPRPVRRI